MASARSNVDRSNFNKVDWDYFDELTIANGATTASFFTNTAGKTPQQTNFPTNGQLPAGTRFVCRGIAFAVLPMTAAAALILRDVLEVVIGRADLLLNNKPQHEAHPWRFGPGGGLQVDVTAAAAAIGNGFPAVSNIRRFETPVYIEGQRVEVKMTWTPGVTLATSAVTRCYLIGTRYDTLG